jgi:hypothetical protein
VDAAVEINAGLLGPNHRHRQRQSVSRRISEGCEPRIVASFMIFDERGGKPAGQFYAINGFVFAIFPA